LCNNAYFLLSVIFDGANKIPLNRLGLYFLDKKKVDEGEASVEFVLAVLRQHEIEFERIIAQLEFLVDTVNKLSLRSLQQPKRNHYSETICYF